MQRRLPQNDLQHLLLNVEVALARDRRSVQLGQMQPPNHPFVVRADFDVYDLNSDPVQGLAHVGKHLMLSRILDLQNRQRSIIRVDESNTNIIGRSYRKLSAHLAAPF